MKNIRASIITPLQWIPKRIRIIAEDQMLGNASGLLYFGQSKMGMMKQKKVCVIGAGPSGITALKNLLDEGIEAVAFDRNQEVGGQLDIFGNGKPFQCI